MESRRRGLMGECFRQGSVSTRRGPTAGGGGERCGGLEEGNKSGSSWDATRGNKT
jgi:hypothetical protein